ncbi:YggT family protein [Aneurinibacillus uraniidurans]|uniref:YggT family protein n=1 Tax=Aneurinibacillus uraniidurans TaxID=2966586 RepID=UPI002349F503|nr:YggT family protein [Aneurinibacillus sp. B1]WCN39008.1 YggT family protein [Aneurinibacillus sp. B1]
MEQVLNFIPLAFKIYYFMIIVYILMSWVPQVRETSLGEILGKLVEPYLEIFRRFIPPLGVIDISPIVALIALQFAQSGLMSIIDKFVTL